MSKKRIILIAVIIAVLVIHCGAILIYENYQAGWEFNLAVNRLGISCDTLARSIAFYEERSDMAEFSNTVAANRHWFDYTLSETRLVFQYEDVPLREDVRSEYVDFLEEIYQQTNSGDNNAGFIKLFTDPVERTKIETLRAKLNDFIEYYWEFDNRYDQMSIWEKCFTSWSKELELLSEKVKLS